MFILNTCMTNSLTMETKGFSLISEGGQSLHVIHTTDNRRAGGARNPVLVQYKSTVY